MAETADEAFVPYTPILGLIRIWIVGSYGYAVWN